MEDNREIRSFGEIRAQEDSRKVEGYAAVYDTESLDLGGFTEIIARGAFDDVIPQSDVFARFNHNGEKVLARSNHGKGSLKLSLDEKGLHYEFNSPKTELGNELLEFLRSGDISESSFAFTVASDTWTKTGDGKYLRTINKIDRLYDVSPVWNAAYGSATSVSCRSFEEFKEKEAEEERKAQEEAERLAQEKREQEEREAEEEKQKAIKEAYERILEENKKYMIKNNE